MYDRLWIGPCWLPSEVWEPKQNLGAAVQKLCGSLALPVVVGCVMYVMGVAYPVVGCVMYVMGVAYPVVGCVMYVKGVACPGAALWYCWIISL